MTARARDTHTPIGHSPSKHLFRASSASRTSVLGVWSSSSSSWSMSDDDATDVGFNVVICKSAAVAVTAASVVESVDTVVLAEAEAAAAAAAAATMFDVLCERPPNMGLSSKGLMPASEAAATDDMCGRGIPCGC